jgi:hypothetical protein
MKSKTFNILEILVFAIVFLMVVLTDAHAADRYEANFMPKSAHHGEFDKPYLNERHNGIGITVIKDNNFNYGLMHFKNSYGIDGFMLHGGYEASDCRICLGGSIGYAPMYNLSDQIPALPMVSVRYKWVKLVTVPGVVSTIILNVPLRF